MEHYTNEQTLQTTPENDKSDIEAMYHNQLAQSVYAGFGIRFWSFIIDLLIIFGIRGLILKPIYHFTHIDEHKLWIEYFSLGHLLDALVFYLYFVLLTKFFKQTIGKMICNIDCICRFWYNVLEYYY